MSDLKPCPFCGRKEYLQVSKYESDGVWWHYVECTECMANGPVGRKTQDATDAWNERAKE